VGLEGSSPIVELDVSYHPFFDPCRTFNFSIDNLEFEGSTPEPPTFALILTGVLVTAFGRRRYGAPQG
jgi:hypothetical protein